MAEPQDELRPSPPESGGPSAGSEFVMPEDEGTDHAGAPSDTAGFNDDGTLDQASINEALARANLQSSDGSDEAFDEVAAAMEAAVQGEQKIGARLFEVPNLDSIGAESDLPAESIELLRDVELNVKIELGRSRMLVEDVLRLGEGSVVELDKLAGDPVDVLVNERLVARGEVLVLNDNFCVRVNEIYSRELAEERLR